MKTSPKPPTAKEINAAREIINPLGARTEIKIPEAMKWWRGECWHKGEIYLGILIGLQIAKAREEKEKHD